MKHFYVTPLALRITNFLLCINVQAGAIVRPANMCKFFSEHAPEPPYNGLAFGTLHNNDLWRHCTTKL